MNTITKNLLEGKICEKCKFYETESGEVKYCSVDVQLDSTNPYLGTKPIPKEHTCERWDYIPHLELRMSTQEIQAERKILKDLK